MKTTVKYIAVLSAISLFQVTSAGQTLRSHDFGLVPDELGIDAGPVMKVMVDSARVLSSQGRKVTLELDPGTYHFHRDAASSLRAFISNHDQEEEKKVGILLSSLRNVTLDGRGANLLFHGQMLPLAVVNCSKCTVRNLDIDFAYPQISQAVVISNDGTSIAYRMEPWVEWEVQEGTLWTYGEGWRYHADYAMAFDGETRHIIQGTSDLPVRTTGVRVDGQGLVVADGWKDDRLVPGTRLALRTWDRPNPGVFLSSSTRTRIYDVTVHYAEGMGLVAQTCQDIVLDRFNVCLRGDKDPRYFTTQADATHFSGCRGRIVVRNGLFEAMMDDAVNVHGTYLKVVDVVDDRTVLTRYMHPQTYGFDWGFPGDRVSLIRRSTMETAASGLVISDITPVDGVDGMGMTTFMVRFAEPLPENLEPAMEGFGMENTTWTPDIFFRSNTVRNNRARGALFSTPGKVRVSRNVFDHTSGSAILLCGDCNGWYETGLCNDVVIRRNEFINSLTSRFQFTNAVISIYPVIPDMDASSGFFHHNITVRKNVFRTFTPALIYARSTSGIVFAGNRIEFNSDFIPEGEQRPFVFEHVENPVTRKNRISWKRDASRTKIETIQ